jgi:ApaG protein
MYFSSANDFRIAVVPRYKDESTSKHDSQWEYSVFIENNSKSIAQLVSKHWRITYADGTVHEILGSVSTNEKQIIEPGAVLELKNTVILKTSSAIIKGHYVMASKGEEFDIDVPVFSLDNPYKAMSIN